MKKIIFVLLTITITLPFGCKNGAATNPDDLSAQEEFELLPDAYDIDYGVNQYTNFFKKDIGSTGLNSFLFFKTDTSTIQLQNLGKVSWVKGLKNICVVCGYGGNYLMVYDKNTADNLMPPDRLFFNNIKIQEKIIIIEFIDSSPLNPNGTNNKIYGRYDIEKKLLSIK